MSCIHFITLNTTQLHSLATSFYRVCPSSTNETGWVVVRVTVTKSTGEGKNWQDMSLKVSRFRTSAIILLASLYNGSDSKRLLHLPLTSCHGSLYGRTHGRCANTAVFL